MDCEVQLTFRGEEEACPVVSEHSSGGVLHSVNSVDVLITITSCLNTDCQRFSDARSAVKH